MHNMLDTLIVRKHADEVKHDATLLCCTCMHLYEGQSNSNRGSFPTEHVAVIRRMSDLHLSERVQPL